MLIAAGVSFRAVAPDVNEADLRARIGCVDPRALAVTLAEAKASTVSIQAPMALVLGSDSLVVLDDGQVLDKPRDRGEAREHLRRMSARSHQLVSAAAFAQGGDLVWRHVDAARIVVRRLSDSFIDAYLDEEWPAISGCVGCYRVEGPGVQLFERIEGSHFTVLGLPLLAVLGFLREREVLGR